MVNIIYRFFVNSNKIIINKTFHDKHSWTSQISVAHVIVTVDVRETHAIVYVISFYFGLETRSIEYQLFDCCVKHILNAHGVEV